MGFAITAISLLVCAAVIYAIVAVFMRSEPPNSGQEDDQNR
jgi:hypothetical protein